MKENAYRGVEKKDAYRELGLDLDTSMCPCCEHADVRPPGDYPMDDDFVDCRRCSLYPGGTSNAGSYCDAIYEPYYNWSRTGDPLRKEDEARRLLQLIDKRIKELGDC